MLAAGARDVGGLVGLVVVAILAVDVGCWVGVVGCGVVVDSLWVDG